MIRIHDEPAPVVLMAEPPTPLCSADTWMGIDRRLWVGFCKQARAARRAAECLLRAARRAYRRADEIDCNLERRAGRSNSRYYDESDRDDGDAEDLRYLLDALRACDFNLHTVESNVGSIGPHACWRD